MSNFRFIKFIPSEEADYLQEKHPNAFLLLCLIAKRARRVSGYPDGLEIGEAHIGDYRKAGIETERQYRTAKDILIKRSYIKICETCRNRKKSTTGSTTLGTKVKLLKSAIWDINIEVIDDRINDRPTTDRRPTDDEQERIRKNKKEKEEQIFSRLALNKNFSYFSSFQENSNETSNSDEGNITYKVRPNQKNSEEEKLSFGEDKTVKLTQKEYENLLNKMDEKEREDWIDAINLEIGKKGEKEFNKKYKSHYHTILSWKRLKQEKMPKPILSPTQKIEKVQDPKIQKIIQENKTFAKEMAHKFLVKNVIYHPTDSILEIKIKRENTHDLFHQIFYTSQNFKKHLIEVLREVALQK